MRGIKCKENCYLWVPQEKALSDKKARMLHTRLEHQVTPKELELLHSGSADDKKCIIDGWFCKENNKISWYYEKHLDDTLSRVLNAKHFDKVRGELCICPHEKLHQLISFRHEFLHSLLHANPGLLSQTCLKPPTTRNNSYPIITFFFTFSKFKNIRLFPSLSLILIVSSSHHRQPSPT